MVFRSRRTTGVKRIRRNFKRAPARRMVRRRAFTRRRPMGRPTVGVPVASRSLNVVLPWAGVFSYAMPANSSQTVLWQGNGIAPFSIPGQTTNNHEPSSGDYVAAGALQYSNFYDRYTVNASSFKVEICTQGVLNGDDSQVVAVQPILRCCLIALPFIGTGVPGAQGDTWLDRRNYVDSINYQQALSLPNVKWHTLGMNTGGNSRCVFKMYRKTAAMVGVSRINNDPENYSGQMQDGLATIKPQTNPNEGFIYFVKIFNTHASLASPVVFTTRMKLYCTLTQRQPNIQTQLTT